MKKNQFLSNSSNKQSFIDMLISHLQKVNCQTGHSQADADLIIVPTAEEIERRVKTIPVGVDTHLFILPYTEIDGHELLFQPETKSGT